MILVIGVEAVAVPKSHNTTVLSRNVAQGLELSWVTPLSSTSACVVGQSVTLPQKNICALKGTDVYIPCTYTVNGYTVQSKEWYRIQTSGGWGRDLRTDPEYKTRVEYDDWSCGLRIKQLSLSDSGVYNFRFKTWNSDWISDPSGVTLSVTGIGKSCWSVTYRQKNICALRGSSVDLSCSYTYPAWHTVTTTLWFNTWQYWVEPTDLSLDEDYEGRVEFRGDKKSDCTLRIRDLRESDARNYKFRFLTNQEEGKYSGTSGVSLSITDLQVTVTPDTATEGQRVTLTCYTTCTLSNNPTYIWYKNGKALSSPDRVSTGSVLFSSEDRYSCAVKGHEDQQSPAVYPPKNTRASINSSGDIVEGSSVILTCSSDANPPVHTYTWYKKTGAGTSLIGSGQNYSITNISSEDSGQYYCKTENILGPENSTFITVDVLYPPKNTSVSVISSGSSVTLICISDANPDDPVPLYDNINSALAVTSDSTQGEDSDSQDYTNCIQFSQSDIPLYSTLQLPHSSTQEEEVQYATLNFTGPSAATRREDTAVIYSTVQKATT
ncbi:B-cell receptor CD22-like [Chanos chanos]|uniref:B-cell receptor CD22 n=1 Tax=Chanos chanos TaxID=29144 RepID=A0A6J2W3V7_CHACN|nr:B-cell receptor CD22-like [Chanos chanos]